MSLPLAVEGVEAAWAALPTNKKLAVAAKIGMWSEFAGERAYNFLKPKIKKVASKMKTRLARTDLPSKKRRKTTRSSNESIPRANPALKTWGVPKGKYSNAKTYTSNNTAPTVRSSNTLYGNSMTIIPKTSTNGIHERQRDVVNLQGVSYWFSCVAAGPYEQPLQCNIAVISSKKGGDMNSAGRTSQGDFFRDLGASANRSQDFNTTIGAMDKHMAPINNDEWRVVSHDRFTLNPRNANTAKFDSQVGSNYVMKEKYIPINKQVRYTNAIPNDIESGPLYFVYWFTHFQGGVAVESDVCSVQFKLKGTFTEVSTC